MARPQYMNFPFPFYKNYSRSPNHYNFQQPNINNTSFSNNHMNTNSLNYSPTCSSQNNFTENDRHENFKQKNKSNKNDDYLFDLFGLKIYSDDVLLVSLIYFLYSEGVKDDSLFLVLVLLLLS